MAVARPRRSRGRASRDQAAGTLGAPPRSGSPGDEACELLRKEAAPPPDPVPTLDISPTDTDYPTNSQALVILPLDATGMIKAELLMYHFFESGRRTPDGRTVDRLDFTFRLNSSTELAKKLQDHCNTFDTFGVMSGVMRGLAGKHAAELRVTTTEEKWSIPANTLQIDFVFHRDRFADDDKLLRMFATVCPMTFGTMIAVLREEYVNPLKDPLKKWGEFGPPLHVSALARELERIWEAWVRILKNMPVGIGKRDDSWKATKAEEIAHAEWAQRHGK